MAVGVHGYSLLDLPFASWNVDGFNNFTWQPRRSLQYLSQQGKEILDCRASPGWSGFLDASVRADRRFGIHRAVSGCEGHCLLTAQTLQHFAYANTAGWRREAQKHLSDAPESQSLAQKSLVLLLWQATRIFQKVVFLEIEWEKAKEEIEELCPYGLLFVSHYWPDALPDLGVDKLWQKTLLGYQYSADFLASTAWPLSFWDLLLGMNSTSFKTTRSMLESTGGAVASSLLHTPLLRTSIDPQSLSCVGRYENRPTPHCMVEPKRPNLALQVAVSMGHVSLTVEIATVLMRAAPLSNVTVLCHDKVSQASVTNSSSEEAHMFSCSKMCSLSARFCNSPRVGFVWDDFDKEWVGHTADVLVCFEYFACVTLGERHGKPLIIYDGMQYGAGVMGFPDKEWLTLPALRELVEHDVYVQSRVQHQVLANFEVYSPEVGVPKRLPAQLRTLLVTNDPWNAESIFFRTGLRVPSARVVSYYLSCRYNAASLRSSFVFVLNCRGRCGACLGFWNLVSLLTPPDYPVHFYRTEDYVDYCGLAMRFRAMVMVPHGNVMQMMCFEGTNMALPVLLPDLRLMSRQPFLWWSERMTQECNGNHECLMKFQDPPKPSGFERPHPFPFLVSTMPQGPERTMAMFYWMRLLDYFHWDWALHFESAPHLLEMLLQTDRLWAASQKQRRFMRREKLRARRFWQDGLRKLVEN